MKRSKKDERLFKEQLLRLDKVQDMFGVGSSTVWLWVKAGKLPVPYKLSKRITVWKRSELEVAMDRLIDNAMHFDIQLEAID